MIRVSRRTRLVLSAAVAVLGVLVLVTGSGDPILAALITLAGVAGLWETLYRDRDRDH